MATAAPTARPAASKAPQKADATAWLGVLAGALGSLMATLDISIVNSSLPTIQGEIGASTSEGTWVATAYLVAEIVIIPLTGWLERIFGLRTFLLIAAGLFTAFSVLCGISGDLTTMIVGRVGQGFTGGAMIPTALTIIATRLPPPQQPIGTALFGSTIILGPVVGPVLGGWLTEQFSWHYAFFINVPICGLLIALLLIGLPHQKPHWDQLVGADWLGIGGMSIFLAGLTIVLEEGNREQWFSSELIIELTIATAVGFAMLLAGQFLSRRPVVKLSLLGNRQFLAVFILSLIVGASLYGVSYVIPQFLAAIAGYNALQAGQVVFLSGIPSLMMMPFVPLMLKHVDLRAAVGLGLAIMAYSCWVDTALTAASTGPDFTESQLLRGVGQILAMMFLNQAAISSVDPEDAGDASGLFNAARNLGGSIGLALLATLQEQRIAYHSQTLHSQIPANDLPVQGYVEGAARMFGGDAEALARVYRLLDLQVLREALVMAFNDEFFALTVGIVMVLPLVLLLKPLPKGRFSMAAH